MSAGWGSFWLNGWENGSIDYTLPLSDTVTLADASVKAPARNHADTVTLADASVKAPAKNPSDTVTVTDANAKSAQAPLSDSYVIIDTESETDGLAEVVGVGKGDTLFLTDGFAPTPTVGESDSVLLADIATIVHGLGLSLADTVTLADASLRGTPFLLEFDDSLLLSDGTFARFGFLTLDPVSAGSLTLTPVNPE